MNMYKIEEMDTVKYVNENDVKFATIGDCLDAGWSDDSLSIYRDEDGNMFDCQTKEVIDEDSRLYNYLCVSYWDGDNWQYDIYEDCELTYIENVDVINNYDKDMNPCYVYNYKLFFVDGDIKDATSSNMSGSLSPYYIVEEV